MDRIQMEQILRATYADRSVSRNERRAFAQLIDEQVADEGDLAYLRHVAFDMVRSETLSPATANALDWLEDILKVLAPGSAAEKVVRNHAYFSPDDDCAGAIRSLLARARNQVDICVFTITDDDLADAITAAHQRGVEIRIISDNDKSLDRGSDIRKLRGAGIEVRCDRCPHHMHHKFAVFDRSTVLSGSYNWTRGAAVHNQENLIVSEDPKLAATFGRNFQQLWDELAPL